MEEEKSTKYKGQQWSPTVTMFWQEMFSVRLVQLAVKLIH